MVLAGVPLQDLHVVRAADLPDQLPGTLADRPDETGLRYLVARTRWRRISNTVCDP